MKEVIIIWQDQNGDIDLKGVWEFDRQEFEELYKELKLTRMLSGKLPATAARFAELVAYLLLPFRTEKRGQQIGLFSVPDNWTKEHIKSFLAKLDQPEIESARQRLVELKSQYFGDEVCL